MTEEKDMNLSETRPSNSELPVVPEKKPNEFQDQILFLIPTVGTIELTEEQKCVLYKIPTSEDIEIRPDGMIYLPWMEYVARLRKAFGMGWALIPQGMPKLKDSKIYWPFYLVIQGKLAGFAIGEQEYISSNYNMSYGDAVEGAKSNAMMRLCKGVGIGIELWKPSFWKAWRAKYAEEYYDEKKGKKLWRKKNNVGSRQYEEVAKNPIEKNEAKPDMAEEKTNAG